MRDFPQDVRRLKDALRARIFRGELREGARLVDNELRREFSATTHVVRAALKDLSREGLVFRKRRVGTFVADELPGAVMTVLPRVRSVGLLCTYAQDTFLQSDYAAWFMTGLRAALHAPTEVNLLLNPPGYSSTPADIPHLEPERLKRNVQGLIALEAHHADTLNGLVRAGLPLTVVDFAPRNHTFDVLWIDHQEAGFLATEHLLRQGHRRIAFLGEGPQRSNADPAWQARLQGYRQALSMHAGEAHTQWLLDIRRNVADIPKLLPAFHRAHKPTAYVVASGGAFEPTRRALNDLGMQCPRDVSIASADPGVREPRYPELSSAKVDYELAGRCAVRLLASRLACPAMPAVRQVVPVDFHELRSTAARG
ncbi:MAG: GntR family transcriptional regulator [Planctomycetes bacterium]|nr:GntR family transcriptional regulator [Planctomycetota bacterium]